MAWTYIDTAAQVWTHSAPNSNAAQIANAREMWNFFRSRGYSEQATAAIMGNAQEESALNPAQWQYGSYVGNRNLGYGLFQWDPAARYWDTYCNYYGYDRTDGYYQCLWVDTQTIGGIEGNQWIGVVSPTSWDAFKVSTDSAGDLAYAFCRNWERGNWEELRRTNATYWYNYFHDVPPGPDPPGPTPTPQPIPVWLLARIASKRGNNAILKKNGRWFII